LVSRIKEKQEGGKTTLQYDEEIKDAAERIGMAACCQVLRFETKSESLINNLNTTRCWISREILLFI